jgi:hypothetical protein
MDHDTRIPVLFGHLPHADDMVLVEDGQELPLAGYVQTFALSALGHSPGCACCAARSPAAAALAAAFRGRATGTTPFFNCLLIISSSAGRQDIETAVTQDAVSQARYRLG